LRNRGLSFDLDLGILREREGLVRERERVRGMRSPNI